MNLILFGPQGSGKGTQSALLAKKFNLAHIEVGQLLREASHQPTPLGERINEIVNIHKELVPDPVIFEVLENAVQAVPAERGIILDGAPRRESQIEPVEQMFAKTGRPIDACVYLDISEAESLRRISNRYQCVDCGHKIVLGRDANSDLDDCPFCGGDIQQRSDDTPEGIKKRLEIFHRETKPVVEHYWSLGKLVEIKGEQSVEEVFNEIVDRISN